MRVILLLNFCWAFALANNERVTYEGYKVYKIHPDSIEQVDFLRSLEEELNIDYWTISKVALQPAVALLNSEFQEKFEDNLRRKNIKWDILIEDVKGVVEQEYQRKSKAPKIEMGEISFDEYHKYDIINAYIEKVSVDNPTIAFQESIGSSYESREIKMLSICKVNPCEPSKPMIFIECGIHAREWIAPAVCLYVIQELVDPINSALIQDVNWHIVPILNVDGYVYSHEMARFWRKTRSLSDNGCFGVDIDRNFDFHYEFPMPGKECSETYSGLSSNSEKEVDGLFNTVNKLIGVQNKFKLYLSIHSYGQYILYPYSYSAIAHGKETELKVAGERVAEVIQNHRGSSYLVGNCNKVRYEAAGTSMDWSIGKDKSELSYTIELPGGGAAGFDLPPTDILRVVNETFAGIKEFHAIIQEPSVRK